MDIPFKTLHHNNSLASFSFPTLSSNLFSLLNKRLFHHVPKAGKSSHLEKKTGERTHEWGQLAKKCMPRVLLFFPQLFFGYQGVVDPSPATSPTSKAYARHAPRPKRLGNQQHPPEELRKKTQGRLVLVTTLQLPGSLVFFGNQGLDRFVTWHIALAPKYIVNWKMRVLPRYTQVTQRLLGGVSNGDSLQKMNYSTEILWIFCRLNKSW